MSTATPRPRVTISDLALRLDALAARVGAGSYPLLARDAEYPDGRPILSAPATAVEWLTGAGALPFDGREVFRALTLDARHRLISSHVISVGCLTASLVHPREVFRPAILDAAAAVVLCHNHPSGDPEPSAEDMALTRRLAAGGALLGIEVVDHLVIGDGTGKWVSLKERGLL
jgi:DNA repair protein RadC